jgi:hypothetical protein
LESDSISLRGFERRHKDSQQSIPQRSRGIRGGERKVDEVILSRSATEVNLKVGLLDLRRCSCEKSEMALFSECTL